MITAHMKAAGRAHPPACRFRRRAALLRGAQRYPIESSANLFVPAENRPAQTTARIEHMGLSGKARRLRDQRRGLKHTETAAPAAE